MCRKSTSPPTRKAFYTSCVCTFLQKKKKAMKRAWPNIFQAFRNQNQIFFVFFFWAQSRPSGFPQGFNAFAATPWPNSQKTCHTGPEVFPPVFSPIFLECYNDYNSTKPIKTFQDFKKSPRFFITKKRPNVQNCRFQATHSLPWPKSAPPFSVPTNER